MPPTSQSTSFGASWRLVVASIVVVAGCSDTTIDPPSETTDTFDLPDAAADQTDDGSSDVGEPANPRAAAILTLGGNVAAGEQIYLSECESCHRVDGTGVTNGGIGKDLTDWLPRNGDAAAVDAILNGRAGMLAYDFLSDQEIADVLAYVRATFDTE
jgi:mono/diheme cytochrome c family protein